MFRGFLRKLFPRPVAFHKVQVWVLVLNPENPAQISQVLILKNTPERGSNWQPVTGSVDPGESLEYAAKRELFEETGIEGKPQPLGYTFSFEDTRGRGLAKESVFYVVVPELLPVRVDPREHVGARWCDPAEALVEIRFESNKEALKKLFTKIVQTG